MWSLGPAQGRTWSTPSDESPASAQPRGSDLEHHLQNIAKSIKSAGPSPSGEWGLPEQSSSAAFLQELPGNADGRLTAFLPSALGEDKSHSDQSRPSHPRSRVMGQRAAGSPGGFSLPCVGLVDSVALLVYSLHLTGRMLLALANS